MIDCSETVTARSVVCDEAVSCVREIASHRTFAMTVAAHQTSPHRRLGDSQ
jgi:hypothetical protein